MPKLVRLYIRNVAIGFGVAAVFVGLLLALDILGLRSLATGSKDGPLAVFLLWFMHGIVFAGVQFGWAVMALAERDETPRGGLRQMIPVRVRADERRRPF